MENIGHKLWKSTKVFLIVVSLIWSIFNILNSFKKGTVNLLAFTSLTPLFIALYTEIDLIYICLNKIKAFFCQKTASFNPKFYFLSSNIINLEDVEKNLKNTLEYYKYKVNDKTSKGSNEEDTISYIVENHNGLSANLLIQLIQQSSNEVQVVLSIKYQVSYKDVKACWSEFCKIKNKFFELFSNAQKTNSHYSITIDTKKTSYNPFYRLTVRKFAKVKITSFNLKFKSGSMEIQSTPHKIYCTSSDEEDIDKVINEYIPLSKVI